MKKHILRAALSLSCAAVFSIPARADPPVQPESAVARPTRKTYSEYALAKMTNTLCTEGFKAYVGRQEENVCALKAREPDIAYTCVWERKGTAAYPPTLQGPCTLDYAEHEGNLVVERDRFPGKPLPYGTEVQCCYRAAAGADTLMIEAAGY